MDGKRFAIKDFSLSNETTENPLLLGTIRLTLIGSKSVLIENFKGLIEYNDTVIVIQSKKEHVTLHGTKLNICYYTKDEMKVLGNINKIEVKDYDT